VSETRVGTIALLLTALASACSPNKNHAQRERAAAEAEADADALDAGRPDGCIRSCLPDPGSLPVDCAKAEEGYEFAGGSGTVNRFQIWNLADTMSYQGYTYQDGSALDPTQDPESIERCGEIRQVKHVRGGPFAGWGGGAGLSIKDWWNRVKATLEPPPPDPPACVGPGTPFPCENLVANPEIRGRFLDASAWDGISLWIRRGPEGQDGVRVTLGDKYTDDELNIDQGTNEGLKEQLYCKRARTCSCHSNRPCTSFTDSSGTSQLCYDPRYDSLPVKCRDLDPTETQNKFCFSGFKDQGRAVVQYCGQSACDDEFPAGGEDPAFDGKACIPYQLQSGENASYCFDPGEAPPPENYERCGDHWQTPIRVSTDWQLFLIPFSDMRQQGYGKESQKLLTDQLTLFRLTWEGGYVDYYIDDVRFYRVKR
jgi:hypothetical protein